MTAENFHIICVILALLALIFNLVLAVAFLDLRKKLWDLENFINGVGKDADRRFDKLWNKISKTVKTYLSRDQ